MAKNQRIKSVAKMFMRVDFFGEKASFHIDGEQSYNSIFGAIISIGIIGTIMAYGINKYKIMKNFEETNFQQSMSRGVISDTQVFTFEET